MPSSFASFLQKSGIDNDTISAFESAVVAIKEDAEVQGLESKQVSPVDTSVTITTVSTEAIQDLIKAALEESVTAQNHEIAEGFIELAGAIKSLRDDLAATRSLLNNSLSDSNTEIQKQIEQASPSSLSWIIKSLTGVTEERGESVGQDTVKQFAPRVSDNTEHRSLAQSSVLFSNITNGSKK